MSAEQQIVRSLISKMSADRRQNVRRMRFISKKSQFRAFLLTQRLFYLFRAEARGRSQKKRRKRGPGPIKVQKN